MLKWLMVKCLSGYLTRQRVKNEAGFASNCAGHHLSHPHDLDWHASYLYRSTPGHSTVTDCSGWTLPCDFTGQSESASGYTTRHAIDKSATECLKTACHQRPYNAGEQHGNDGYGNRPGRSKTPGKRNVFCQCAVYYEWPLAGTGCDLPARGDTDIQSII